MSLRRVVLRTSLLVASALLGCSDDTAGSGSATESSSSGGAGTLDASTGEPATTTTTTTTGTSGESTGTGEPPGSTSTTTATTGDATTDASSSGSSSGTTGEPFDCVPGEPLCKCSPDETCKSGSKCIHGGCAPTSGMCAYELDGFCDEPDFCEAGTDPYDCCATKQNGVCDEISGGGECAIGSDWFDCGYCPFVDDGTCDEGGFCPAGTDANDCCATQKDGVCEEQSMGGTCKDGSDTYDCGYCLTLDDLKCDEGTTCPEGTDPNDCCATIGNGVCEEVGQGGMCPDGTDPGDCFECEWANDGECDEPNLCPPGTDGEDCCATPENGVCEEISMGGMCPDGTDWIDCGTCQWANDGVCDEPNLCPPGTDGDDCCAGIKNGMCEEVGEGGMCPDGSDDYDCGVCQWPNDGVCDEPNLCPPGSDMDCV